MNEIFLDTETTGLSFKDGHKIVEIACVETNNLIPTKKASCSYSVSLVKSLYNLFHKKIKKISNKNNYIHKI